MTCLSHHLGLAQCFGIVALLVCGCGQDTGSVTMTASMGGHVSGQPPDAAGHNPGMQLMDKGVDSPVPSKHHKTGYLRTPLYVPHVPKRTALDDTEADMLPRATQGQHIGVEPQWPERAAASGRLASEPPATPPATPLATPPATTHGKRPAVTPLAALQVARIDRYRGEVVRAAALFDVPPNVLHAIAAIEHSGEASESAAGAYGLCQTMPNYWTPEEWVNRHDVQTQLITCARALRVKLDAATTLQGAAATWRHAAARYFGGSLSKPVISEYSGLSTLHYVSRFDKALAFLEAR